MRRADPITDLRRAIDCLPLATRRAMLDGVRANAIVMGAYTDGEGGVCPMLAAHRNGGRTSFLAFAKAWDALGGRTKALKATRRATQREVRILTAQLEASLLAEEDVDLAGAIAEHEAARRAPAPAPAPAAPTPHREIQAARLTGAPGAIRRLRPRRADAEGAFARFEAERERAERRAAARA